MEADTAGRLWWPRPPPATLLHRVKAGDDGQCLSAERDWTLPAGFGPLVVLIAWLLAVLALALALLALLQPALARRSLE